MHSETNTTQIIQRFKPQRLHSSFSLKSSDSVPVAFRSSYLERGGPNLYHLFHYHMRALTLTRGFKRRFTSVKSSPRVGGHRCVHCVINCSAQIDLFAFHSPSTIRRKRGMPCVDMQTSLSLFVGFLRQQCIIHEMDRSLEGCLFQ